MSGLGDRVTAVSGSKMSDFDILLDNSTLKGDAQVHGAIMKCVDKHGKTVYSKISGYDSIAPNANPLEDDAVVKLASATKLIASIALLQCVDKGLVGLDQSLTAILPELEDKQILKAGVDGQLMYEKALTPITTRHLLSHTSGLTYPFLHPLILKWKKTSEGMKRADSRKIVEKFNNPLIFEPGNGWAYGLSLDWAGVVVSRLHGNQNFEDYCNEHIWAKVGLSAPYPTFHISQHPDYRVRLMGAAARTPEGGLEEFEFWQGDDPDGEEAGGHGLSATVRDMTTLLADLISDHPKLLSATTRDLMFQPQIEHGTPGMAMLLQLRPVWETVAGPIVDEGANHGLGGFLTTKEVPEAGQPAGVLCWGGASNVVWFASREQGVSGFFATQIDPFGDPKTKELIDAWKKDFWGDFNGSKESLVTQ
ncbi:hypothetical protein FKW77_001846 [Venturia effusa]|uniref:Beta-lactamase-related domain-containing protein n=1 Tax=Venturia effusa TaxID=50376 RepID=A0A517LKW4_9PEZI|nr:hypothetical protein FKW77_001846 [Venturia effusa]